MDLSATGRSLATLVVLAVIFLGGVAWAWSQVTDPFPEPAEASLCTETEVTAGDQVRPGQVLVSVLNASERVGLASETMDDLVEAGFGQGERGNIQVAGSKTMSVQIWTSDKSNPAVRLVASRMGRGVEVVEQAAEQPGVVVVVGERFKGLRKGRPQVKAQEDTTICVPAVVAEEPAA